MNSIGLVFKSVGDKVKDLIIEVTKALSRLFALKDKIIGKKSIFLQSHKASVPLVKSERSSKVNVRSKLEPQNFLLHSLDKRSYSVAPQVILSCQNYKVICKVTLFEIGQIDGFLRIVEEVVVVLHY